MIFVTVGTQLPFERLVAAVDRWAGEVHGMPRVLAQVGSGRVDYPNIECRRALHAEQYARAIAEADLVVAHAGMGSILTALDSGVPIVILARDNRLGECRSDHQIQTARQLDHMGLVKVAWSECQLGPLIEQALDTRASARPRRERSTELVDFLRGWLGETLDR